MHRAPLKTWKGENVLRLKKGVWWENDAEGRGETFEGRRIAGGEIQASKKKLLKIVGTSMQKSRGCGRHPSYATEYIKMLR